ncbi:Alcohol dehydrogenase [Actinomycetales bacterium JB111]|nr:Alcohol dehydrogenase [Actinomycetales bacterium JB111]
MRALLITEHGGLDKLALVENHPVPTPGPGEALVRVRATSLNYHDLFTLRGMPGITVPLPIVPGLDVAGEVVEVADDVAGWSAGDHVLVYPLDEDLGLVGETRDGGLAEYLTIPAEQLIALPDGVSFADAAALPVAYGTAYRMIVEKGTISAGENVLVLGASGGVGTAAVTLAKGLGAHVVAAVGSEQKREALLAAGADWAVNYREDDVYAWARETFGKPSRKDPGPGLDVIVNFTGGDTWRPSLRSLGLGGRILVCGATAGYDPVEDLRYIWSFEQQVIGSNGFTRDGVEALLGLVGSGSLTPPVTLVDGLDGAADAFARLEGRDFVGKIVITQGGE